MKGRQIFGLLLLIAGIIAVAYGVSERNSFNYRFASAFGGNTSGLDVFIILAALAAIIGLIILCIPSSGPKRQYQSGANRSENKPSQEEKKANRVMEVSEYDEAKLKDIIDNSAMYEASLVTACKKELDIRIASESLKPKVKQFDEEKLCEIIENPGIYSEELIYCCQEELNERQRIRIEEQEKEEEKMRIQREKEAEERRLQRIEKQKVQNKKIRKAAIIVVPVIIAVSLALWLTSDSYRYDSGLEFINNGNPERGIKRLCQIDENSEYYSVAQHNMYKAYLQLKDSVNATKALRQAVVKNNWDCYEAYEVYTDYLMKGTFVPFIGKNELAAAEYYKKSRSYQLKAGEIYFKNGKYLVARELFDNMTDARAKGYRGIMYLYGLGGLRDMSKAYDCMMKAPNTAPFLVHKGDLTLYINLVDKSYGMSSIKYSVIKDAKDYYELALAENPEDEAISLRLKAVRNVIAASEKANDVPFNSNWETYNFTYNNGANTGTYSGEIKYWGGNYTKGAHGWGCFAWDDHSLTLGHFSYLNLSGIGLRIQRYSFTNSNESWYEVIVGNFVNDNLKEGIHINGDGVRAVGTFNSKGLLAKGQRYDLHGKIY